MKTGNCPCSPRSQLANIIPKPMDTEEIKSIGWHEQGILVVSKNDARLNWEELQTIEIIGKRLYGHKVKVNL